jgi:hypothetical protein
VAQADYGLESLVYDINLEGEMIFKIFFSLLLHVTAFPAVSHVSSDSWYLLFG